MNLVDTHVVWVQCANLEVSGKLIENHASIPTHKLMNYLCPRIRCMLWMIQSESRIEYNVYWRPYLIDDVGVEGCWGCDLKGYESQF